MASPLVEICAVEICVDDLAGALVAERGGADRIELCGGLEVGGTTPGHDLLRAVLGSVTRIGVQVMIRPRGGSFVYSADEVDAMCADIALVASLAASAPVRVGVVVGALTGTGEIDEAVMRRLLTTAGALGVTCHKAFDEVPDLDAAYETLREIGVERVLTSGGAATASAGADVLAGLVTRSAGSAGSAGGPVILLGGSVRPHNVRSLLRRTGAGEVHLRASRPSPGGAGAHETDPAVVAAMVEATRGPDRPGSDGPAGRPTPALGLASERGAQESPRRVGVLALDIGGTSLKGMVVDARGRGVVGQSVDVGEPADAVHRVTQLLRDLTRTAGGAGVDVVGAGVVSPGMIDAEQGLVRYASTLRWTDVPLGPILERALRIPVVLGHDVRSAGLAESLFGASAGIADSVLVSIGTGVAASILSSGTPIIGAITTAGELGHIPVVPDGEACTCGQVGCLEVYFSGAGLARRYAAAGGAPGLDAAAIGHRIGDDAIAESVWSEGIRALAQGLTTLTLLLDPQVVVLTGGVSQAGEALLGPLRARLDRSLVWRARPAVRRSLLGTSGGRIGAAVLAFRAAGLGHLVESWTLDDVLSGPD